MLMPYSSSIACAAQGTVHKGSVPGPRLHHLLQHANEQKTAARPSDRATLSARCAIIECAADRTHVLITPNLRTLLHGVYRLVLMHA